MILLPIVIGDNCSVGVKSIISPGAVVSSNTHIGPLSSSPRNERFKPLESKLLPTNFTQTAILSCILAWVPLDGLCGSDIVFAVDRWLENNASECQVSRVV